MGIWLKGKRTPRRNFQGTVLEDTSMYATSFHRPDGCHENPSPKIPIFLPAFISIRQALCPSTRWLTVTKLKALMHYRQKNHSVQPSSSSPCLHPLNTPLISTQSPLTPLWGACMWWLWKEKVDSLLEICLFSHWKEKSSWRRSLQTQPSLATKGPNLEGTWEPMELESIPSDPALGIGPILVWEREWRLTLCAISVRAL